jgi:hypothetical protein
MQYFGLIRANFPGRQWAYAGMTNHRNKVYRLRFCLLKKSNTSAIISGFCEMLCT